MEGRRPTLPFTWLHCSASLGLVSLFIGFFILFPFLFHFISWDVFKWFHCTASFGLVLLFFTWVNSSLHYDCTIEMHEWNKQTYKSMWQISDLRAYQRPNTSLKSNLEEEKLLPEEFVHSYRFENVVVLNVGHQQAGKPSWFGFKLPAATSNKHNICPKNCTTGIFSKNCLIKIANIRKETNFWQNNLQALDLHFELSFQFQFSISIDQYGYTIDIRQHR